MAESPGGEEAASNLIGDLEPHGQSKTRKRQLGERLRGSLQAHQVRRREIVRITGADVVGDPNNARKLAKSTPRESRNIGRQSISSGLTGPTRPTSSRRKRRRSALDAPIEAEAVDRWAPDVSHLAQVSLGEKSPLSSVVCIHGLPNPCTPSMIRKFFSGLECKQILVLLRHPFPIDLLDANHEVPIRKEPRVERYHPTVLRVLVEFENAPTALLACGRSKELLVLPEATADENSDDLLDHADDGIDSNKMRLLASFPARRAAVAVTPVVSKHHARTIRDYVSIDVSSPHHGKIPLHVAESRAYEMLDPLVPRVLWTVAKQAISTSPGRSLGAMKPETGSGWNPYSHLAPGPLTGLFPLKKAKQDNEPVIGVERLRAALQSDLNQLLFPASKPLWVTQDPDVLRNDSVTRLTWRAAECLRHELDRCSQCLAKRRVYEFLSGATSSDASLTT